MCSIPSQRQRQVIKDSAATPVIIHSYSFFLS